MVSRVARVFAGLALTAAVGACAMPPRPAVSPRGTPRVTLPDRLLVRTAGKTIPVNLEDYVVDTILSEVSPVGDSDEVIAQIFEVQAIIARTYGVARAGRHRDEGFDVCDTTHCQLYQPARRRTSRFTAAALEATSRTHGEVLTYQAVPIEALFHADCGGSTVAAEAVWGGLPVPYLRTIVDNVDEPAAHRS
jgi:SpoIID/LytB domain protein